MQGKIITFYSYKGGTGRTMALANMACLLAKGNQDRILMIDWDLEAPGLAAYFKKHLTTSNSIGGVVDFMLDAQESLPEMPSGEENQEQLNSFFASIKTYLKPVRIGKFSNNFFLLDAGDRDTSYAPKVSQIDWQGLFAKIPRFFTLLSEYLCQEYDYVLIDSRTGFTDVGGICTMLMPEKLVLTFTPNNQSLNGVVDLARRAMKYRSNSDDLRPLMIYPLPSRVELEEEKLRHEWGHKYKKDFEVLFQEVYELPRTIKLDKYFEQVMIRHASRYAYGENIAVLDTEESDRYSLSDAYASFCVQLTNVERIWEFNHFGGINEPFKTTFLYTEEDQENVNLLVKHLQPLRRQNVLEWDQDQLIAFELWNENQLKRFATNNHNLVFTLISKKLEEKLAQMGEDPDMKSHMIIPETLENANGRFIGILLDSIKDKSFISKEIKMVPSRLRSVNSWKSEDKAWNYAAEGIKRIIIQKIEEL